MGSSLLNILFHFWENKKEKKEGRKLGKRKKDNDQGKRRKNKWIDIDMMILIYYSKWGLKALIVCLTTYS